VRESQKSKVESRKLRAKSEERGAGSFALSRRAARGILFLLTLWTFNLGLSTALRAQSVAEQHANLNNVRYATAFAGADACAKIQAAINDLPVTGGTVRANFEGTQVCAGGFTVGTLPYAGPAAPTLSYVSGGTLAAMTYYVKTTWVDSAGESLASAESSLAVPADDVLVVSSPASGGVLSDRGWNVYVSTATGTETLQNQGTSTTTQGGSNWAPIAIGTNWTEATTGITTTGVGVGLAGTDNKPVELRLGGETLIVGAPVTVYDSSSITGLPMGTNTWVPDSSVIMAAANANLPEVVVVNGTQDNGEQNQALRYVTIDGNNQAGAQVGLLLNSVGDFLLDGVTTRQAASDGIELESSCCALLRGVFSIGNKGNGLHAVGSSDLLVSLSQFEENGANGIELDNTPTIRLEHSDVGGNGNVGLQETCTGTSEFSCGRQIIVGNQFGNNAKGDISFIGTNAGAQDSEGWVIAGNSFIARPATETGYPEINIQDSGYNAITGNHFDCGSQITYAVDIHESATGRESPDSVTGNAIDGACATAPAAGTRTTTWANNANFGAFANDVTNPPGQSFTINTDNTATGLVINRTGYNNKDLLDLVAGTVLTYFDSGGGLHVTYPGYGVNANFFELGASGPTWTSGSAAPTGACTTGSLYSNTAGGAGTTLYACVASAWADVK
jgi:hypothetical protein